MLSVYKLIHLVTNSILLSCSVFLLYTTEIYYMFMWMYILWAKWNKLWDYCRVYPANPPSFTQGSASEHKLLIYKPFKCLRIWNEQTNCQIRYRYLVYFNVLICKFLYICHFKIMHKCRALILHNTITNCKTQCYFSIKMDCFTAQFILKYFYGFPSFSELKWISLTQWSNAKFNKQDTVLIGK